MSEPQRWLESAGFDEEVQGLLRAARPPRSIAPVQLERSARRVARLARLPAALAGALWWLRRTLAIHPLMLGSAGVLLALVLVVPLLHRAPAQGSVSTGGEPSVGRSPEPVTAAAVSAVPSQETASAINVASPIASAPLVVSAPSVATAARPAVTKTRAAPSAATPRSDDMAAEIAALERIRAKVAGDPCGTLGRLDEHERRFSRPQLGVEREVLRIEALDGCGQHDEARTRARALLARSPGTLYESELRQVIEAP